MNVKQIVAAHLVETRHDGLFNAYAECACELADIMPCGGDSAECEPGYRHPCRCGEGHQFHMKNYIAEVDH